MIHFNNKVTSKKLKSLKKIKFLLNDLHLRWKFYDADRDIKYKDIIDKEYKNLHLKNNLYKIIIIEDLSKKYLDKNAKVNYLFLWISIFKTDIRINRVSLFENEKGLSLIKVLDLNNTCRFSIFLKKLNDEDKKVIKMVEDRWTKAKIPWHRITKEELYDYFLIAPNMKVYNDCLKRSKIVNIYLFDNTFFDKMDFFIFKNDSNLKVDKKTLDNEEKITIFHCYKYNFKKIFFDGCITKYCDENFNKYFYFFVNDITSC